MLPRMWQSISTQKQYIIENIMYVSQNDSLLKSLWSSPILKESDTCYLITGDEKWPRIH